MLSLQYLRYHFSKNSRFCIWIMYSSLWQKHIMRYVISSNLKYHNETAQHYITQCQSDIQVDDSQSAAPIAYLHSEDDEGGSSGATSNPTQRWWWKFVVKKCQVPSQVQGWDYMRIVIINTHNKLIVVNFHYRYYRESLLWISWRLKARTRLGPLVFH